MQSVPELLLERCKCGGKARYMYRVPSHFVECKNKTCGIRTRYYPDVNCAFDPDARKRAIDEWNEMNGGTDNGNVL